jgi:hypothetical protein
MWAFGFVIIFIGRLIFVVIVSGYWGCVLCFSIFFVSMAVLL